MNVFVIPSWYPSPTNPMAGIFFQEQAMAIANIHNNVNVGISTWGQNDERLLLWSKSPFRSFVKFISKPKPSCRTLDHNLIEYFTPAFTWSRRFAKGNISEIVNVNEHNFLMFQKEIGEVDIIHAHVAYPGGLIAMVIAEKHNIPFVITEHMSPFPFSTFLDGEELSDLIKIPYQKSALNIAVSNALKRKMASFRIDTVVIPNLVDGSFFTHDNPDIYPKPIEILSIGRLEEQKGYSYLLEAFQLVRHQYPEAILKIIGVGALKNQLIRQTHTLGLQDAVKWVGHQTREQVRDALQQCTLLAMASIHENLPLVLLEALACGKPIITTQCEGPEEIVNETNGMLAEAKNIYDLYQKIVNLIVHIDSYDGVKIRKDFESRYSSKVVTLQLIKTYHSCIEKTSSENNKAQQ